MLLLSATYITSLNAMGWVVFSYSLPSKVASSRRVTLWRRLQRLGAITPKAGVYVLPAQDECLEAFQWLAQEVQQARGEEVVMLVERFEGLTDAQITELFREACNEKYAEIEAQAAELEMSHRARKKLEDHSEVVRRLQRLRKRHAEVARTDFFNSSKGTSVAAQLRRIQEALLPGASSVPDIPHVPLAKYRNARWVTRPRPHVDRLASAWLIRRFINPAAAIRYATPPEPGEVAFDMRDGEFGHRGNLCTFETMVTAFRLNEPGLQAIAEIVHEIDLRDNHYVRAETIGIDVILKGWLLAKVSDSELEARGIALFDGLHAALSRHPRIAKD